MISFVSRNVCTGVVRVTEVDLVEPAISMAEGAEEAGQRLEPHIAKEAEEEIVEAQGWIINDRGITELVAYSTDINGSSPPPQDSKICPATEPIKQ